MNQFRSPTKVGKLILSDSSSSTDDNLYVNGNLVNTNLNIENGNGDYSLEQKTRAIASGANSFSTNSSIASARNSFAQNSSIAGEALSHSEGEYTRANGYASHTEGGFTRTSHSYQHAAGFANAMNSTTIEEIGYGEVSFGIVSPKPTYDEAIAIPMYYFGENGKQLITEKSVSRSYYESIESVYTAGINGKNVFEIYKNGATANGFSEEGLKAYIGAFLIHIDIETHLSMAEILSRGYDWTEETINNNLSSAKTYLKQIFPNSATEIEDCIDADHLLRVAVSLYFNGFSTSVNKPNAAGAVLFGGDNTSFSAGTLSSGFSNIIGDQNDIESGKASAAIGRNNLVKGQQSLTIGGDNTVGAINHIGSGWNSFVAGINNTALGNRAMIFGANNTIEEDVIDGSIFGSEHIIKTAGATIPNTPLGDLTSQGGFASHVEGQSNIEGGSTAHVEGVSNINVGIVAHVEGTGNTNNAAYSHTEGLSNVNVGPGGHVEGMGNTLIGLVSHAEGYLNTAAHAYSHVGGVGNRTSRDNQTVIGQYNLDEDGALLIVGNGTSLASTSNAFVVLAPGFIRLPNYTSSGDPDTPVGYKTFKCLDGVLTPID